MSPEQKRKFNTLFGTVFLVSGIFAWGLAAYYAKTPNEPQPAPVIGAKTVDLQSCATTLRSLGYPEVSVQKNDVIAHESLSMDPKAQLEKASIAATVCKLEVKYFCIGESCPQPGITIISTAPYNKPSNEAEESAAAEASTSNSKATPVAKGPASKK